MDPDSDSAEPKLILKRSTRDTVAALEKVGLFHLYVCFHLFVQAFEALSNPTSDVKSFEEREEEYEKTRARIFNQQPMHGSRSNIAFDLGSAPQRTRSRSVYTLNALSMYSLYSSLPFYMSTAYNNNNNNNNSLLPAIMQHRRTVSDTLLFRRPSVLEELMKDAPNSSHSSRSATPLLALLQPPGEGGIVGQAIVGQVPAGSGVVTPQHSPQQQTIISPREVTRLRMNLLSECPWIEVTVGNFLSPFPITSYPVPKPKSSVSNTTQ